MHPYSTDSPANPQLIAVIAIVSGVVATGVTYLAHLVSHRFGWALSGASSLSVFGLFYFVFNHWAWRNCYLRAVLLVPDLNGVWECEGRTLLKCGTEVDFPWTGTIEITQSWTKIAVVLRTPQSLSKSIAASLYREPMGRYRLIYHYHNAPGVGEHELSAHSGLCRLLVDADGDSAAGDYFTDRDRLTVGTMRLTRKGRTDAKA